MLSGVLSLSLAAGCFPDVPPLFHLGLWLRYPSYSQSCLLWDWVFLSLGTSVAVGSPTSEVQSPEPGDPAEIPMWVTQPGSEPPLPMGIGLTQDPVSEHCSPS